MVSTQYDTSRIDGLRMDLFVAIKRRLRDEKAARKMCSEIISECWQRSDPGDYESFIRAVKSSLAVELLSPDGPLRFNV